MWFLVKWIDNLSMRKKKLNIIVDKSLRLKLTQGEYRYKIVKSIIHNNNKNLLKKNYIVSLLDAVRLGKKKNSRKKTTCIVTGSRHSITYLTNFCRQQNKRFIFLNKLDNFKVSK